MIHKCMVRGGMPCRAVLKKEQGIFDQSVYMLCFDRMKQSVENIMYVCGGGCVQNT